MPASRRLVRLKDWYEELNGEVGVIERSLNESRWTVRMEAHASDGRAVMRVVVHTENLMHAARMRVPADAY